MGNTHPGLDELVRLRQRWGRLLRRDRRPSPEDRARLAEARARLIKIPDFGPNPGELRMLCFVPSGLPAGAPLVVALHGCTQDAAGYDLGCGWSAMAERLGFVLLLPEQRRENNPNLCFNWFNPGDTTRNSGEVASIRQMIAILQREHRLDPTRIFISGLSAGGGMSSAMLACYPEVFAGGAILAGLPHGAADTVRGAFQAMYHPAALPARERGNAVRTASAHQGPWPRLSVWQGDADVTVKPQNAEEILKQWLDLHGLRLDAPSEQRQAGAATVRRWRNGTGEVVVESHNIPGLDHGVPLAPGDGDGRIGRAGPYLLDAGLSSTHGILRFWGLGTDQPDLPRRFVVNGQGSAREVTPRFMGLVDKALRMAGLRSRR
ncbi:extracellular catalytic domain type 1 short-chain-length polyhydroxyalkanoate depolymerase [Teichococcus oryzae]|uniref:PHB depolymerase family esterase n=1 Tax=Teichococcus oryzae TaxID=1608942 RepID=A0A5B2TDE4_9PROT|nr:PHB depolymerase family esterase [Pseudoroseomonas oryzae]KAA2212094.1 PHB depolymerase family esterase [Pseudoroseomonas oryzae]